MLAHSAVPMVPVPHRDREVSEEDSDTALGIMIVAGLAVLIVGYAWFWWMKRRMQRRRSEPPSITHRSGSGRGDRPDET